MAHLPEGLRTEVGRFVSFSRGSRDTIRLCLSLDDIVHRGLLPIPPGLRSPSHARRYKRLECGQPQFILPSLHVASHRLLPPRVSIAICFPGSISPFPAALLAAEH